LSVFLFLSLCDYILQLVNSPRVQSDAFSDSRRLCVRIPLTRSCDAGEGDDALLWWHAAVAPLSTEPNTKKP